MALVCDCPQACDRLADHDHIHSHPYGCESFVLSVIHASDSRTWTVGRRTKSRVGLSEIGRLSTRHPPSLLTTFLTICSKTHPSSASTRSYCAESRHRNIYVQFDSSGQTLLILGLLRPDARAALSIVRRATAADHGHDGDCTAC